MAESMEIAEAATPRWYVSSLDRGLKVLSCFGAETPVLKVGEIAKRTGISRAAVRRFLMTLEALGYVGSDREQRYFLRANTLSLGYSYLSSLNVAELVQPALQATMEKTGESCSFVILDGHDIVYVARAISYRTMQMMIRPGDRLPCYATSMGRVLLSGLSDAEVETHLESAPIKPFTDYTVTDPACLLEIVREVRRAGYACVEHEIAVGIASLAVPIRGRDGRVLAAININSQSGRLHPEEMVRDFLPSLQAAAEEVGKALGSLPSTLLEGRLA